MLLIMFHHGLLHVGLDDVEFAAAEVASVNEQARRAHALQTMAEAEDAEVMRLTWQQEHGGYALEP